MKKRTCLIYRSVHTAFTQSPFQRFGTPNRYLLVWKQYSLIMYDSTFITPCTTKKRGKASRRTLEYAEPTYLVPGMGLLLDTLQGFQILSFKRRNSFSTFKAWSNGWNICKSFLTSTRLDSGPRSWSCPVVSQRASAYRVLGISNKVRVCDLGMSEWS